MANIPAGTMRDWKDKDIVNAADYKQEREILRTAINDNDSRTKVLETNVGNVQTQTSLIDSDGQNNTMKWYGMNPQDVGDALKVPYTGAVYPINLNGKSLSNAADVSLSDVANDGVIWKAQESGFTGSRSGAYELRSYNTDGSLKATAFSVTPDGNISMFNQSFAEVAKSTAQSIASSTWTKVTGFSKEADKFNEFSNDKFTAREGGLFAVYANPSWAAMTANRISSVIYKNGSNGGTLEEHSTPSSITTTSGGVILLNLVAGDGLEFYVYQNSGVSVNLNSVRLRFIKLA